MIAGDEDGNLWSWNMLDAKTLNNGPAQVHKKAITSVVTNPNGREMVTCSLGVYLSPPLSVFPLTLQTARSRSGPSRRSNRLRVANARIVASPSTRLRRRRACTVCINTFPVALGPSASEHGSVGITRATRSENITQHSLMCAPQLTRCQCLTPQQHSHC